MPWQFRTPLFVSVLLTCYLHPWQAIQQQSFGLWWIQDPAPPPRVGSSEANKFCCRSQRSSVE